jgi:hypothetical protein
MGLPTHSGILLERTIVLGMAALLSIGVPLASHSQSKSDAVPVDQGDAWSQQTREAFYDVDQGSRIMPLQWAQALQAEDGAPFLGDSLKRFGYLRNPASPKGLPLGFTGAEDAAGIAWLGMTCAACHTRDLEMDGKTYRLDGGPAFANFQNFLSALDNSVDNVLSDQGSFEDFSNAVLGANRTDQDAQSLESELRDWYHRYHTIMHGSLPKAHPWGPGRLDAMGMIVNRLAGLDIGPPPTHIIASNIKRADAPVRYPFLWNADKQACTQWLGFARNDNDLFRTARNIGQVLGVFADFRAARDPSTTELDWWAYNSVNLRGLGEAEILMSRIGPPRWPFEVDRDLAAEGAEIYKATCNSCHESNPGPVPWETPIRNVGTDMRAMQLLKRRVSTGVLADSIVQPPFSKEDNAISVLYGAVTGMLLSLPAMPHEEHSQTLPQAHTAADCAGKIGYEAKVLHGVWGAAPYLHNGSVPTLADLLKPASERPMTFEVGPAYDPIRVGLAAKQVGDDTTFNATGCNDPASGHSNCGHEYGINLEATDKAALLEYLKTL